MAGLLGVYGGRIPRSLGSGDIQSRTYNTNFNKQRRPKNDLTFEALGATDELNACIGLAKEYSTCVGWVCWLDRLVGLCVDDMAGLI